MKNNCKPTFIGIGAQKSATTWLAAMMRNHPQIFITPAKEIHYFDREEKYASPNYLNYNNIVQKFINRNTRSFHIHGLMTALKWLLRIDFNSFLWRVKFHLNNKPTMKWYLSLFNAPEKYIAKGEITPGYSLLNEEDIAKIKSIDNNLKILLILRNPIERAWSFIRYEYSLGHIDINNYDAVNNIINSEVFVKRYTYSKIIEKWSKYFSEDKFCIFYYDDIIRNPGDELKKVFSYLNVDPLAFDYNNIYIRKGVSRKAEMPDWVRNELTYRLKGEMKKLAEMYDGWPREWYNDYITE